MLNNHVKLFIAYKVDRTQVDVYIGSQNLTHGTNLNLMYQARNEHVPALMEFFENIWRVL